MSFIFVTTVAVKSGPYKTWDEANTAKAKASEIEHLETGEIIMDDNEYFAFPVIQRYGSNSIKKRKETVESIREYMKEEGVCSSKFKISNCMIRI